MAPRRYCVLVCGKPPNFATLGGYGDALVKCLRSPNDEVWTQIDCEEGREPLPSLDEDFDAVVISGSKHDAHAATPWIQAVGAYAASIVSRKRRVLGVCFGAQLLAQYLGGSAGPDHAYGWELGTRILTLAPSRAASASVRFARADYPTVRILRARRARRSARSYLAGAPAEVAILQCHKDQVLSLPPDADRLGSSPRCENELWAIGDHVLAIQGHPEMVYETLEAIMDARPRLIDAEARERCAASLASSPPPDPRASDVAAVCRRFLAGGPN